MAGRRRGARSGRGWDAAPPLPDGARRARKRARPRTSTAQSTDGGWLDDEGWPQGATAVRPDTGRQAGRATPSEASGLPDDAGMERDPAELARDICLRLLAARPRTRAELATALRRRGIADGVAGEVLGRYDEVGIIDDAAFARAWVSSRHHGRGLARRALAVELRQRGVDNDTVGEALEELDPGIEAATARALVDRKLRTLGRAAPEAAFRRLVGMLARKGYAPGVAVRAVKDALAAQSAEAAEFAEQIDADAIADAAGEEPETAPD